MTREKHSEETKLKISIALRGRPGGMLGKKHSKETRRIMSEIKMGNKYSEGYKHSEEHKRKVSEALKGKPSGMLGKKTAIETRKKLSEAQRGERGSNWQGGVTLENQIIRHGIEYSLWRESVFARDNWTCQKTGERGGKLEAHHVQNFADYPELRTSIENGITLSRKAHKEFHRIYGNNYNTKEQMEEFLII